MSHDLVPRHQTRRRAIELAAVIALAVALMTFEPLHELTRSLLERVTAIIAVHPLAGKIIFVVASALSAMLAFFSSAIIVPAAVIAWGPRTTVLLLWSAWLAGGCCTYAIGRTLGGRIAAWLVSPERLAYYVGRISGRASLATVVLFQIALPSEIPGYVPARSSTPSLATSWPSPSRSSPTRSARSTSATASFTAITVSCWRSELPACC